MIVDTSKIIVFALVAITAFGFQMYKDKMTTINLRLNIENGLLIAMLMLIILILSESISNVVENVDNVNAETIGSTVHSLLRSPETNKLINDSTLVQQTLGSPVYTDLSTDIIEPLLNPTKNTIQQPTNTIQQPTNTINTIQQPTIDSNSQPINSSVSTDNSSNIINAPMTTGPTGIPTSIPNTFINKNTKSDNSNLFPSNSNVKVILENNDQPIEVDVSVNNKMQEGVIEQLGKLVSDQDKTYSHKYVLSDPTKWVHKNNYKMNVLSKCETCPVTMCDQNFMSI